MRFNLLLFKVSAILLLVIAVSCNQNELPTHPRIMLLKGEESALKKSIASDKIWDATHHFILDECEKICDLPPVKRELIGKRLLDKSREALRRIFYLSYAWRMTSEDKYLDRAEMEMLAAAKFEDWNPSHFLDVAEMTMALSIGYDWLYRELSPESRKLIREAIITKGLVPSLDPDNNWWLTASHNWNQVCNAGMTFGALAIYETDPGLASEIIDRAAGSIRLPMEDYLPDGAYPEGYSYWGYGTSFNVMYLSAMEKAFGKEYDPELNEGFLKSASYLENMTGPSGICFNYSDCGAGGSLQPAMFWFAQKLNDPSLLWSERHYLLSDKPSNDRLLPAILIWSNGMVINDITPPAYNIRVGQGKNPVALMRTSWENPDAIFVGLKGGSPSVNHGHMDAGSFVMEANGVRWAMDLGMQNYNSLETAGVDLWNMSQNSQRWEVFRYNNFVHNTLTVNGKLQVVDGYAPITGFSGQHGMLNAITDITAVYREELTSATRGIAIVDDRYVIVRDELETNENESVIRWNLLTSADVTITGNNTAELVKEGKKLVMKVTEPAKVKLKTWSTVPQHDYDAPNPGTIMAGFEISVPAGSKAVLNVLLLPEGTVEDHSVSLKSLAEWPKDNSDQ